MRQTGEVRAVAGEMLGVVFWSGYGGGEGGHTEGCTGTNRADVDGLVTLAGTVTTRVDTEDTGNPAAGHDEAETEFVINSFKKSGCERGESKGLEDPCFLGEILLSGREVRRQRKHKRGRHPASGTIQRGPPPPAFTFKT